MKLLLPLLICYSLMQAGVCSAGSWRVEQDGTGDFLVLQSAVDVAASGDTIFIGPGWYQDLQWGSHGVFFLARWTESKDLVFIGENVGTVILGPASYAPISDGPYGIYSDSTNPSNIVLRGMTLTNLNHAVFGFGELTIENCRFETGNYGIVYLGTSSAVIRECSFDGFLYSCVLKNYETAMVEDCQIESGLIYFENVNSGLISGCDVVNGALARYISSEGVISGCEANSPAGSCISANGGGNVLIEDSRIASEENAILANGEGTSIEVVNSIIEGGTISAVIVKNHATFRASGCDIYRHFLGVNVVHALGYTNESFEYEINVAGNYWGNVGPGAFYIDDYIWDQNDDPNNKVIVNYSPIEGQPVPTESANWGSVKAMFR